MKNISEITKATREVSEQYPIKKFSYSALMQTIVQQMIVKLMLQIH